MKQLSEWQLSRVRDALRAFHRYERGKDDEAFTWKDVREAIVEYIGIEIGNNARNGAERLRVFVDGVEDVTAPGGRKFSAPKPDTLKAIIAFLTHEDLNLLTEDELKEFRPEFQAPLRLAEFLRKDTDYSTDINWSLIAGEYVADCPVKDGWMIRVLTLNYSLNDGIAEVAETRHHYATENAEEAFKWHNESNHENLLSYVHFGGWAIVTPEDSLTLFLKRESNGQNHKYICLEELCVSHEKKRWVFKDNIHNGLFMLLHDYGHDFRHVRDAKRIMNLLETDMFAFQKITVTDKPDTDQLASQMTHNILTNRPC